LLAPECEVILFGAEEGTAEIAAELGVRHFPDVLCNEYGTPLVNSAFEIAQNVGRYQLMCYANADIVLMSDMVRAVSHVQEGSFLLLGRRWNVELSEPMDFSNPAWESALVALLKEKGELYLPSALDYFVFPRGLWTRIPPFAIGRPGWDNWMVYHARSKRVPVIDATQVITAVHQNHDYSHLPKGEEDMRKGVEARRNRELLGGTYYSFNVLDATSVLTPRGLERTINIKLLGRRLERLPEVHPHLIPIVQIIRAFRTVRTILLSARNKLRALTQR
jgi:hypothetical protein